MVVTKADGEPISASGNIGKPYDESKIDGKDITQDVKTLKLDINKSRKFLESKITDAPDTTLPYSLKLQKIPDKRLKAGYRHIIPLKIKTLGSAYNSSTSQIRHDEEVKIIPLDVLRIRMMTDPYNFTIRRLFSDAVFQDPTIAPVIQKRNKAFFANGYYMDFELKSMINPATGEPYLPMEAQLVLAEQRQAYLSYLLQLDTWAKLPNIDIMDKMKRSHISVIDQGRALNLIVPKPSDLSDGELPLSIRNITWENTGQVYVDTIYWQIVGVRLFFINKDMASPDEMVYITGKNWGLRWLSDYYGASELEPFVQMSRINRMILNYHLAKAAENAYMNKLLIQADVQGDPTSKKNQLSNLVNSIISQGTDIIALEYRSTPVPIPINVDSEMMEMIIKTLDDRLISGLGSTRAQMGRTEGLNRDTATIMEVENIRNVRTPDEELIGNSFAQQLFDQLLAHLANKPIEEIPVRIVIKRIEPTDEAVDPNLENKLAELKGASKDGTGLVQEDAGEGQQTKSFGASGSKLFQVIQQRESMLMKTVKTLKGFSNRPQVIKILLNEFSTLGAAGETSDDDADETTEATIEDVKQWSRIPNSVMLYHYINPNRWDDRDDYEFISANAKNFDQLTPDQQLVIIRSYYFRNPGKDVTKILASYGFETPQDPSAYCWTVLMPTHKQHLIDPEQMLSWSKDFVETPYDKLNPQLKEIADLLYKFRHTPHDEENLKSLKDIPEFPSELS